MAAVFASMLPALYARLGDDALFAHDGGTPVAIKVLHDKGGGAGIDGMMISVDPVVRLQASSAPHGVARGDLFTIPARDGTVWKAREAGRPILDGAELQVPLCQP